MTQTALILIPFLAVTVAVQAILVIGYCWALNRFQKQRLDDAACPRAAVILCVRGHDPTLAACLKGLLRQDYPAYDIWVVVDSVDDAAWSLAHETARRLEASNVCIRTLSNPPATCSRKVAALLQAFSELQPSHTVVAMLDSDVVPERDWLRSLVQPLSHPNVAVASGNRWYLPDRPTLGAVVRYAWNAAAVVQMYWYGIAWGGSLALKARLLRETNLCERLRHAFGEDSTICRLARRHGFQIALVPSLFMVDRDACDLRRFFSFLQRQLLTVKLHNPWWWAVVAHGAATSCAMALPGILLVASLAAGYRDAAAWYAAGLAGYWVAMVLLLAAIDRCVSRILRFRPAPPLPSGVRRWLGIAAAIPVTQVVYAVGLASLFFLRTHVWRGIVYRIKAKRVRVVEDCLAAAGHSRQPG